MSGHLLLLLPGGNDVDIVPDVISGSTSISTAVLTVGELVPDGILGSTTISITGILIPPLVPSISGSTSISCTLRVAVRLTVATIHGSTSITAKVRHVCYPDSNYATSLIKQWTADLIGERWDNEAEYRWTSQIEYIPEANPC